MRDVTSANFQKEVLEEYNKIVQVYFWNDTCLACKEFLPKLEQVNLEYKNVIKTVKINTDQNRDIADMYDIKAAPLIYFFQDGKLIDMTVGAFVHLSYYRDHINKIILKSKLSHSIF